MKQHATEAVRYFINGVVAAAVHYSVLNFNLLVLHMQSAGIANFIAACVGISASFLGSRYFVFRNHTGSLASQAPKFVVFYGLLAVMQGAVLAVWTDWLHLDYRIGFLVALVLQVICSYLGNKFVIFKA
ncbi:GtrA family protein [Aestuariivirga litoralis]|uniref:GtrA family protein n=1 Tax=Aestuariivirga litoralis TaxID=2650924 RepID=UPI0018C4ED62|nr:GtrA family protein [Aestuariivirga litoralis]MBG1231766.1 GtrA family protein [Aestuariivirga litoralis]